MQMRWRSETFDLLGAQRDPPSFFASDKSARISQETKHPHDWRFHAIGVNHDRDYVVMPCRPWVRIHLTLKHHCYAINPFIHRVTSPISTILPYKKDFNCNNPPSHEKIELDTHQEAIMNQYLSEIDFEIIKAVKENAFGDDTEQVVLDKMAGNILHPKTLEAILEIITSTESITRVGHAMIDGYKHHLSTGNKSAFVESVDFFVKFYEKLDSDSRLTVFKSANDFSGVMHTFRDPEWLKLIIGKLQLSADNASVLLTSTTGMDDLIIDAMDIGKGLVDISKIIKLRTNDRVPLFNKESLIRLLSIALQKDASGKLFKRTATALLNSQDIAFTEFQLNDMLALHNNMVILDAMHNRSGNAQVVIDVIKGHERFFIETHELLKKVVNLIPSNHSETATSLTEIKSITLDQLKALSDNHCSELLQMYSDKCFLSVKNGESVYEIHKIICPNGKLDDHQFQKIMIETYDSALDYELKNASTLLSFVSYASEFNVELQLENRGFPRKYFDLLARARNDAKEANINQIVELFDDRINKDLNHLSDGYLDRSINSLKALLPNELLSKNPRIKRYEISVKFEL